ncbi:MAG TPA: signal peptidase [Planctomycetaceae bacterium]|nr:signal peptidase [Planctomycetaceae bacterium]
MRTLSVMAGNRRYDYGDRIVTRTDRGTEFGVVLCEATPAAVDQIEESIGGRIVRPMTAEDETVWQDQQSRTAADANLCTRLVKELGLAMQVVDVERLLGGERIVFFFLADKRIDFRLLVRQLAAELQTRIEMRQIGVRDEAKLLADYGDCGKPVCCNTHLNKMPPVSMRMAKLQKATLDPSKISGRCGRLKCCLRYEFDTYEELQSKMPPVGSRIVTPDGAATVLGHEILAQQLLVQTEDNRRILVGIDSVLAVTRKASAYQDKSNRHTRDDLPDN